MKQALFLIEPRFSLRLLCGVLMASITMSAPAEGRPARFPVTALQILAAMNDRQLPTEGVQVNIPAPITTSIAEPALEIQTIALVNPHKAQIKIACRNHTECLPFYASASWPEDSMSPAIPSSIHHAAGSNQPSALIGQSSSQVAVSKPEALKPENVKAEGSQTIRAGASAMLLMDKDRVHISVRVVCLEGGASGDKVRVTTPDHKQAYVAEIVSPTLLKGSF